MKDEILKYLKESNGFVSGEEMSKHLGVSRTAIWKQINTLKSEGYVIDSYNKKGYRLVEVPDKLTRQELLPVLKTKYIGREVVHFESTDSTNMQARILAERGIREGAIVTSEEQTSGRGRLGRKWNTKKGEAIAFSLVLRPVVKPEDVSGITLVMGTAVRRAIENATSYDAGIKWPNDIILNSKKVCGILTEMSAEMESVNYIIIGVGINVNIDEFPEDIKNIATSLKIETGRAISRKDLLASVLLEFERLYDEFKANGLKNIMDEFKAHSVTLGKHVRIVSVNESFEGYVKDILADGALLIKMPDGTEKKVISGDVSVRGINGYV